MSAGAAISYDACAPVHRLGQYRAWRLRRSRRAPFDLVWISIAHPISPADHRVLPHGEPSIAIRRRRDRTGDVSAIDLTVCGPFRSALWYRPEPGEELIALRLKPETAAAVFSVAPGDYADAPLVPAPDALRAACANAMRMAETGEPHVVARRLMDDLYRHAAENEGGDAPEVVAAAILRQTGGRTRCIEIARRIGVSERQLRRRFRDRLGCSPKSYARQLRLTAAALAAEPVDRPDWAQIAVVSGFHDQAHMINEFQSILRMTPIALHRERRALSGFCNTGAGA